VSLIIRPICLEDKSVWGILYRSYLEFYETVPVDSSVERVWNRITSSPAEIHSLVAELDGEVVGFAHFHYQVSTWAEYGVCYLEDLFVLESAREHGVATALISEVKKVAIRDKCSELYWITKESNSVARKLYDKLATKSGFVRYEISLGDVPNL
jgi:GNAT superfamily N-acetyltransferase